MRLIELLEQALGREAIKNYLPMRPGDVPATYADIDDLMRDVASDRPHWLQGRLACVLALPAGRRGRRQCPPATRPHALFHRAGIAILLPSLDGDVRDADRVAEVVAEHRPEVVIHMAG